MLASACRTGSGITRTPFVSSTFTSDSVTTNCSTLGACSAFGTTTVKPPTMLCASGLAGAATAMPSMGAGNTGFAAADPCTCSGWGTTTATEGSAVFFSCARGEMSGCCARITKSKTDRVIDGVCGGLAEYYGIDPVIVRLIFVVLLFINGIGFFIYIILAIIMPKPEKLDQSPKETIRENVQEMGERVKEAGEGLGMAFPKNTEEKQTHRAGWFGIILILLGIILLLDKLNLIKWFDKDLLWPVIIIFIGVWLLIKRWR